MHNDRVQVRIVGTDKRGRPEGVIVSVTSRAHTHIVGRLVNENGVWLIAPEDRRIVHDILVDGSPETPRPDRSSMHNWYPSHRAIPSPLQELLRCWAVLMIRVLKSR